MTEKAWQHDSLRLKVGVSSCLIGQEVRFNSGHKRDSFLTGPLAGFVDFVPLCPEVGIGMGIPRPSIRLDDSVLRENFLTRIYVYHRWQRLMAEGITPKRLIEFHADHKYLVMAHSQAAYEGMGRMLSNLAGVDLDAVALMYVTELMSTLKRRVSSKRHSNVLQHMMGYFKRVYAIRSDAPSSGAPASFGLVVIGDEVLQGSRSDRHFDHFKSLLRSRGNELAWFRLLPDDPQVLTDELSNSMSSKSPVFVCGGIGATPDDHTRACAAAAAGVPLVRHPQAKDLIEGRFGVDAHPYRILMADLPQDCGLIPNPVNRIPGFCVRHHYFLPGFPEMAWPMAEWVLETRFPSAQDPLRERAVRVLAVPESRLVPVMRRVGPRYPGLKLFSLPKMGEDAHILLGFRGRTRIDEALDVLCAELDAERIIWERLTS